MAYTNKTQPTKIRPEVFLKQQVSNNKDIQKDARVLMDIYSQATGSRCVMWHKIFGFGTYHYRDSKGGEHTHLMAGFALSATGFTLYNLMGWEAYKKDLEKLGTHKISGKSCLALKRVADINPNILAKIIRKSIADMGRVYVTEK